MKPLALSGKSTPIRKVTAYFFTSHDYYPISPGPHLEVFEVVNRVAIV